MKSSKSPSSQRGFSLVELIVVLAIAALVMSFALPSYRKFIASSHAQSVAGQFMRAMQSARTEAIRSGTTVEVCGQASASDCSTTGTWSNGWRIYAKSGASSTILQNFSPDKAIVASASIASMTFAQSGRLKSGADFVITFSTPDNLASSTITVENYGRAHD